MTSSLVLLLVLSQNGLLPEPLPEPPPEARLTPQPEPRPPASVFTRSLLATDGGTLAGGAALGIALLLVGQNANFDPTFATAALASILITGVAFTIHEALGGRGEITLSFLLTAVVMAGAALVATAIDSSRLMAPLLTTAIGSLPAAAAAVFGLEATSPKPRRITVAVGPTGIIGTF